MQETQNYAPEVSDGKDGKIKSPDTCTSGTYQGLKLQYIKYTNYFIQIIISHQKYKKESYRDTTQHTKAL